MCNELIEIDKFINDNNKNVRDIINLVDNLNLSRNIAYEFVNKNDNYIMTYGKYKNKELNDIILDINYFSWLYGMLKEKRKNSNYKIDKIIYVYFYCFNR